MSQTDQPKPTGAVNITDQFDEGRLQPHDPSATLQWSELIAAIRSGGTFWLTTVSSDGKPHTRPVFAVVADGHLVTASSRMATKTTHLRSGSPTSIATGADGIDVVWTGIPAPVGDPDQLATVADAYRTTYGWNVHIDLEAGALTAPYGAPTAGPPPYDVFRITPTTVHAISSGENSVGRSTRWVF